MDPRLAACSEGNAMEIHYCSISLRLKYFMNKHAGLVGLSIKSQYHATEQFESDPNEKRYTSSKGLRQALMRDYGIEPSSHPCCIHSHEAMFEASDSTPVQC